MLDSFTFQQRHEIQRYVEQKLENHLFHETHSHKKTSGGDSVVAKPEEPTTQQQTQGTVITEPSNLVLALGDRLEELDTHINSLTRLKGNLQWLYNGLLAGDPGPVVVDNSDSDEGEYCQTSECILPDNHRGIDHWNGARYFK